MPGELLGQLVDEANDNSREWGSLEKQCHNYWVALYFQQQLAGRPHRLWPALMLAWQNQVGGPLSAHPQVCTHPRFVQCPLVGGWRSPRPGTSCAAGECTVRGDESLCLGKRDLQGDLCTAYGSCKSDERSSSKCLGCADQCACLPSSGVCTFALQFLRLWQSHHAQSALLCPLCTSSSFTIAVPSVHFCAFTSRAHSECHLKVWPCLVL